jgi:hypothetical protein
MSGPVSGSGDTNAYYTSAMADVGGIDQNIQILGEPTSDGKIPVKLTIDYGDGGQKTCITLNMPIEGNPKDIKQLKKVVEEAIHIHQGMMARMRELATEKSGGGIDTEAADKAHKQLRAEFAKGTFIRVKVSGLLTRGAPRGHSMLETGERKASGEVEWHTYRGTPASDKAKGAPVLGSRSSDAIAMLAHGIAARHLAPTGGLDSCQDLPALKGKGSDALASEYKKSEGHLIATFQPAIETIDQKARDEIQAMEYQIQDSRKALEALLPRSNEDAAIADPNIARLHLQLDKLQDQLAQARTAQLNVRSAFFMLVKAHRNVELAKALPHLSTKSAELDKALTEAKQKVFSAMAECEFFLCNSDTPLEHLTERFAKSPDERALLDSARETTAASIKEDSPRDLASAICAVVDPESDTAAAFRERVSRDMESTLESVETACVKALIANIVQGKALGISSPVTTTLEDLAEAVMLEYDKFPIPATTTRKELKDTLLNELISTANQAAAKNHTGIKSLLTKSPQANSATTLGDLSGILPRVFSKHFSDQRTTQLAAIDTALAADGASTSTYANLTTDLSSVEDLLTDITSIRTFTGHLESACRSLTPHIASRVQIHALAELTADSTVARFADLSDDEVAALGIAAPTIASSTELLAASESMSALGATASDAVEGSDSPTLSSPASSSVSSDTTLLSAIKQKLSDLDPAPPSISPGLLKMLAYKLAPTIGLAMKAMSGEVTLREVKPLSTAAPTEAARPAQAHESADAGAPAPADALPQ